MTNREKYAEEILDIACSGYGFAAEKDTGRPVSYNKISCGECLFNDRIIGCNESTRVWANAEYTPNNVRRTR